MYNTYTFYEWIHAYAVNLQINNKISYRRLMKMNSKFSRIDKRSFMHHHQRNKAMICFDKPESSYVMTESQ